MLLSKLYCRVKRHIVPVGRIWHDNYNYRARCGRCGHPLIRVDGFWKEFESAQYASVYRAPHPHFDHPHH